MGATEAARAREPQHRRSLVKILVTGGSGFLGRAICRRLTRQGHAVRSLSRGHSTELTGLGVEQHRGDLRDPAAVATAVDGCSAVIHTGAKAGIWGTRSEFYDINVRGTQHVVSACRDHGVGLLVHTSSASVVFDGTDLTGADETTPYPERYLAGYPWSKALAEQVVLAATGPHLATTVLRPHLIWGSGDPHFLPRLLRAARRPLPLIGDGDNRIDTIHVDNAAEAHLLALDRLTERTTTTGRIYFISQDQPVALRDMIGRLTAAAGVPATFRRLPRRSAYIAGGLMEWLWKCAPGAQGPPLTRFLVAELATSHWFDIGAAKADLAFAPTIDIPTGLALLEQHLRSTGAFRPAT
ncbi:NAD-dependent epimerase/dehydratase family protein [Actinosynnema sp. NPDC050436]|uniref:NAD-dependent epimerase/dehydratase family protein n=1 Tax=Actinosynnema sp. NPDC050436 TaxID=3155659 RepID=UPI0033D04D6B